MDDAPEHSPVERRLPRRTQLTIVGVAAVAALVLLFGLPLLGHLFAPKPPAPVVAPPGTFVATDEQWATLTFATATNANFRDETLTDGKIAVDDDRSTQAFSPYSGRVTHVFAKVGDLVRAGQPLFAVNASEFVQGEDDLATATAQVKLTSAVEERQHELYKINGAAQKDWQQSQSDLATARANLAAVRGRLRILGVPDAQIAAMEQRPSEKDASRDAIVRAPIGGVVTQRAVGEGQLIASVTNGGSTANFVISDLSTVWLVANLREVDAPKAKVGQTLDARVLALPGQVFPAKVTYVSPTVDPVSRRVTVRAELPNPGGVLKPEMFASVSLATDLPATAVGVPADAVIYEGDTARVWVAHAGHALELRQIHAGKAANGVVEVLSGLAPGEQVVTAGALFIDRAAQGD